MTTQDSDLEWAITLEIPHLRRYARSLTRDADVADDLVQSALETALRKRRSWKRTGSVRSWMFSVLHRTFLDQQRAARRRRHWTGLFQSERHDDVEASPQEAWVERASILEALGRLPDDQRAVILLVAVEGFGYDDVARILNVPVGTVRSRLSRGREALSRQWDDHEERPRLRSVK
ncbi:sigma-70 family RNA polymerase sigma factor [Amorphus sp. 3PC139-8]|uniref:sigma-70 family RNA polymerase sigma factor n=1 Tax=Amorphus sp. 3PC139-8 TaxID=2735676 RepID=UPI00345CDF9D